MRNGGGEEERERSAFGEAEDGGLLRPGGVHHRTDVRNLGLEVGEPVEGHRVGQAGAAPVEDDQAADGCEPPALAGQLRDLPERLDVMHPALDQHQVERAVADDLVREVDVAVLRVLGRGQPVHGAESTQITPDRRAGPPRSAAAPVCYDRGGSASVRHSREPRSEPSPISSSSRSSIRR